MHFFFNLGGFVGKAAAPCTPGTTTDPTTAHAPAPNPTPTETHATASAPPLASVTPSAPGQVPVIDNTSDGRSFKQKIGHTSRSVSNTNNCHTKRYFSANLLANFVLSTGTIYRQMYGGKNSI